MLILSYFLFFMALGLLFFGKPTWQKWMMAFVLIVVAFVANTLAIEVKTDPPKVQVDE